MVSVAAPILLKGKGNLFSSEGGSAFEGDEATLMANPLSSVWAEAPFLRIPPFPGAKLQQFQATSSRATDDVALLDRIRSLRVGGSYWARQPELGSNYVLVRSAGAVEAAAEMFAGRRLVLWSPAETSPERNSELCVIRGDCDPWHMITSAESVVVDEHDELRPIAALLGVPTYIHDPTADQLRRDASNANSFLADALPATFSNPLTGEPMTARQAVELCGFWRELIDSNRDIAGGLGFAFWKQDQVAPLLWDGSDRFRFLRGVPDIPKGASVAVWQSKAPPQALAELERAQTPLVDVEDGFLRSRGLGADCIPPLSITVDRLGPHFDPSRPSELENLLQKGEFDEELIDRARDLRHQIVEAGLGKYEQGGTVLDRPAGARRHILVPGQVEDDRAVVAGGCGLTSNLELLRRVRERAPDAFILYKPHPDVLAGHRRGAISDRECLQYADRIVGELPIGSLISMVDEVHVNTSLAGFEALLRGKSVTTHGVPFYAGWGVTNDLGPVPSRRSAVRTIDELVAASLLVYPRYLDPVTGLPCPAEIVVARLRSDEDNDPGLLVGVRRLQGKLMRCLRSLVQ